MIPKLFTMPSSCQSFLSPALYLTFQQFSISHSQKTWLCPMAGLPAWSLAVLFISFITFTLLLANLTWATEMLRLHYVTEKKNASNKDVPVVGTFSLTSCSKYLRHFCACSHTLPILYCPLCYNDCIRLKAPEGRVLANCLFLKALCMPGLLF